MAHRPPSYRFHKRTGQAVVTLNGRYYYLGKYGTAESKAEYDRLIAEYLANGRRPPQPVEEPPAPVLVCEMLDAFDEHAEEHYRTPGGKPSLELANIRYALKPVRKLYGHTPARSFGPLALRAVRDEMIRSGLASTTVNARINRIRRVFRWAASLEMIPVEVVQALETVAGLQRGRSKARDPEPVRPVPIEHVEATLPHLSRAVAAMVRVQLLTGCRAGEVMVMRGCDLEPGEPTWTYRPAAHKNAWRGQERVIPLGPRAVAIIREFLKPDLTAYLFDPREAVEEYHAVRGRRRKTRPTPSELARRTAGTPGRNHAPRYDRRSYRQALVRACRRAGVPEWSPLQLRHTAGTLIRARYGLEVAQVVLGHAKPDTTLIYAERDLSRAQSVMAEIG
jgi:integrase